jgi:AAA domain
VAAGAQVEVRLEAALRDTARLSAAAAAEHQAPPDILDAYLDSRSPEALADSVDDGAALRKRAHELLGSVLRDQARSAAAAAAAAHIQLHSVTVGGFRCFDEPVTLDLRSTGLMVVTGVNEADRGASSNGAGKTALVAALPWALTGDVSTLGLGAGRRGPAKGSVVHVGGRAKKAEVSVAGEVNGREFVVLRKYTAGGRGARPPASHRQLVNSHA